MLPLDEILDLIESVSEGFPTYSHMYSHFKTEKLLRLNIIFYRFSKLYESQSYLFIYLFIKGQLIFCINYA